jgi:hypothetical protein
MIKVKQKISRTPASFKGGEIFCRIKGYIGNFTNILPPLSLFTFHFLVD